MSETPNKHPAIDAATLLNALDKEARNAGLVTELNSFADPSQIPAELLDIASFDLGIGINSDSLGLLIANLPGGTLTVMDLGDFFSGSIETTANSAGFTKVETAVRTWIKKNAPGK